MESGSRGVFDGSMGWQLLAVSLAVVSNLRWYKCPNSTNVDEEPKVHIQVNRYYGRYGLKGILIAPCMMLDR